MTKAEFQLEALTYPICAKKIETAWTKTDGVADVKVLFNASKVKTSFDDRVTGESFRCENKLMTMCLVVQ